MKSILLFILVLALSVPAALIGMLVLTNLLGGAAQGSEPAGPTASPDVGPGIICVVDGPRYGGYYRAVFRSADGRDVMVGGTVLPVFDGRRAYGIDTWYIDPYTCETGFVVDLTDARGRYSLEWVDDKYIYMSGPGFLILDKEGRTVAEHTRPADRFQPGWYTAYWSRTDNLMFYYAYDRGGLVTFKAIDLLNMQVAWSREYPEPLAYVEGNMLGLGPSQVVVSGDYVYAAALVRNNNEKRLGVVAYKVAKSSGELLARAESMATVPGLPGSGAEMMGGGHNLPLVVDGDLLLAGVYVAQIFEGEGLLALFAFDMSKGEPLWINHFYVKGGISSYKLLTTNSGFVAVVEPHYTPVRESERGLIQLMREYTIILLDKATGDTLAMRSINATILVADSTGDVVYIAYQARLGDVIVEALDAGKGLRSMWVAKMEGGNRVFRLPFSILAAGDRAVLSYTEVPWGSARARFKVAVFGEQ